jgi:hypothetical protein
MNSKIKEIIKITFYHSLILLLLIVLKILIKYLSLIYNFGDSLIWIYLLIGVILVIAAGTYGVIENQGEFVNELRKSHNLTFFKKLIIGFAYWGIRIPLIIGIISIWLFNFSSSFYVLLLYFGCVLTYRIYSVLSKKELLHD